MNVKKCSQWNFFQKDSLYLHRCSTQNSDIEESCLALNRLRIWKIQRVRAKGLKAVPLQLHIYSPLALGVGSHIYLQV